MILIEPPQAIAQRPDAAHDTREVCAQREAVSMMLVIVEFQLRKNARAKFERALVEMNARIESYDGYLGEQACQVMSDSSKFVTLFRFEDRDAVEAWRNDEVHLKTQTLGKTEVFSWYRITVADVERCYERKA